MKTSAPSKFYERIYLSDEYCSEHSCETHPFSPTLRGFLSKYKLSDKRCIEIGAGRGAFQDLVEDYTGVDYSPSVARYYHKPFVQASCEKLPFSTDSYDVAWSYAVLEHVDDPQRALGEIRRILKPGGLLLIEPAWQCRPWAADGYPVRPYSDFSLGGKLIKASIPIRDSVLFRSLYIFPRRLGRLLAFLLRHGGPLPFRYQRLEANFDKFWMSDSDAQNSMDPFDALLFFTSLGDQCLNHPTLWHQFLVRTGPLVIRVQK